MDWISNTYHVLNALLFTNVEYLVQSTNGIINEMREIDYTTIATKIFLVYIDVKTRMSKTGNYLYNNVEFIQNVVDSTSYNIKYGTAMYNKYRIEPIDNNWVCVSILLKNDNNLFSGDTNIYLENYQHIKPHNTSEVSKTDYYNNCVSYFGDMATSIANCDNTVIETMVTMKLDESTFNKSFNTKNETETQIYSNVRSKVSFLTIEYTHPQMKDRLVIELDKNVYFANNIVLSSLFIKRYLEYQVENYVFDENYTINLMDNNINMVTLTQLDSILLGENSYTVIKNE